MNHNLPQEKKRPKVSPWRPIFLKGSPFRKMEVLSVVLGKVRPWSSWTLFFIPFSFLPLLAWAQANDVFELSRTIYRFLDRLGIFFWLLATVLFIWGVMKFIRNANDTAEHEKGKQLMLWGIISFVVLVSLWGIVTLVLSDTLDVSTIGELPYIRSR